MRPRHVLAIATFALSAGLASAEAGELTGQATTIARVFDLKQRHLGPPGVEEVVSYRPVDQLLRLAGHGYGARKSWSFDVSLRGRWDLGTGKAGGQDDFDAMMARATWSPPSRSVSVTLGRQQSIVGFGWHAFDGVRVDVTKLRRARFFASAGLPVDLFENDGPDTDGVAWEAGATAIFPRHGSLGVDWSVEKDGGLTLSETVGADLGLSFGPTTLSANADYSITGGRFGETTASVRRLIGLRHGVEARFTRVEPVFPTDSLWAVFTSNPYDEARVSYEYRGGRGLDVGSYISVETYEDTPFPGPQDIRRAALTAAWRRSGARHRGELGVQEGWSGRRLAARWDADWNVLPALSVGGGASVNRYENVYRLTEADEQAALRGRIRHEHGGRWDLACEVETYIGRSRSTTRATLIFAVKLGRARVERPWWAQRWGDAWTGPAQASDTDEAEPVPEAVQ